MKLSPELGKRVGNVSEMLSFWCNLLRLGKRVRNQIVPPFYFINEQNILSSSNAGQST
jgi:hypothetical protein